MHRCRGVSTWPLYRPFFPLELIHGWQTPTLGGSCGVSTTRWHEISQVRNHSYEKMGDGNTPAGGGYKGSGPRGYGDLHLQELEYSCIIHSDLAHY